MIFHAIWDIFVRIPGHFCENIPKGIILDFIYLAQDILNLGVFLLVAILICLKYKPTSQKLFLYEKGAKHPSPSRAIALAHRCLSSVTLAMYEKVR